MHVAIIANVPLRSIGGRLQRLVEEFQKKDCTIYWIDPPVVKSYDSKEINEVDMKNILLFKTPSVKNKILKTVVKEVYTLKYIFTLMNIIDVCIFYDGWGSYLARRFLKKRKITTVFDYVDRMYLFSGNNLFRRIHKKMIQGAFKTSDIVTCTAHLLRDEASEYNPNTHYIPNGAPKQELINQPKNLKIKVGYLGAFGEWVDFSLLKQAIKELNNVEFWFVGAGPKEQLLRSYAQHYSNVNLVLNVPYKDVPKWISTFDICVIPFEINEITDCVSPLKLFEYWSLKKPVICKPTYEITKTATNREVMFVKNRVMMKDAIQTLANHKYLRQEYGEKGYQLFKKNHSFKQISSQFMGLVELEYQKKGIENEK